VCVLKFSCGDKSRYVSAAQCTKAFAVHYHIFLTRRPLALPLYSHDFAILKRVFFSLWKWLFLDMSTTMHCGSPDASLWYLRPLQESEVMTAAISGVLNLLHLFERELGTKNLRPDHLENAVRRNKSNSLKQGKITLVSLSWLKSDFYAILTCLSVFPYCTSSPPLCKLFLLCFITDRKLQHECFRYDPSKKV